MENLKNELKNSLLKAGCVAFGVAEAVCPDSPVIEDMKEWVGKGENADMDYLERHIPLKADPRNVLEDAAAVISVAFSFAPASGRDPSLPHIASYAFGDDYHDVIRSRLQDVVNAMKEAYGGNWRICIDSAPLPERYWAMKSGIGRLGKNGMVSIDGYGCYILLAEILTSLPIPPDSPSSLRCQNCGLCIKACPAGALHEDGTVDCRKCISYLSIEHRGEWVGEMAEAMHSEAGRNTLFGCDRCLTVCPLNQGTPPTGIREFRLREGYKDLTRDKLKEILSPKEESIPAIFRKSPIKRARLQGLIRNVANLCLSPDR